MNKFYKVSFFTYHPTIELDKKAEYDMIQIPKRATQGSAGYDFYAPCEIMLAPNESCIVKTGIKVKLDDDKCLMILPRSSLGFKYSLHLANTVGLIDSDYYNNKNNEGHIQIKLVNDGNEQISIKQGDAFAQGVIIQYVTTVDDDVKSERNGGIGSTDRNA